MISARIPNYVRKAVYRRDNYRCALCDSEAGIQIHHAVPRGQGGTPFPHNLITLCWRCHAMAHGTRFPDMDVSAEDIAQACAEYLADYYADVGLLWNPWEEQMRRIE
mgnify:CR=1 FL=1